MCLQGGLAESDARCDQGWKFAGEVSDLATDDYEDLVKGSGDQNEVKDGWIRKLEDGVGQSGEG